MTEAVLKRGDAKWLGVIGSETKAKRFRQRLLARGFEQDQIDFMQSPVGLESIGGKLPMEVAVSIAASLINLYQTGSEHASSSKKKRAGVQWKAMQQALNMQAEHNNTSHDSLIKSDR